MAAPWRTIPILRPSWPAYPELFRVLKPDSFCVTFYGYPKLGAFVHAWAQAGFDVVGHIVWPKPYVSSSRYVRRRSRVGIRSRERPAAKTGAPVERRPAVGIYRQ